MRVHDFKPGTWVLIVAIACLALAVVGETLAFTLGGGGHGGIPPGNPSTARIKP